MAASYDFVQLDVFTRTALTGNPLAVFIDGRDLTDEEMQAEFRRQKLLGPSYSRAKPLALKFFDVQSHLLWYLPASVAVWHRRSAEMGHRPDKWPESI